MPDDPLEPDPGDPFGPPAIPTEVGCLHCQEEYESYLIEWRIEPDVKGKPRGWWCCPTPACSGRGFGFDIFPTDPDYVDEDGNRMWHDDDEDYDEDEFDDPPPLPDGDPPPPSKPYSDDDPLPW